MEMQNAIRNSKLYLKNKFSGFHYVTKKFGFCIHVTKGYFTACNKSTKIFKTASFKSETEF